MWKIPWNFIERMRADGATGLAAMIAYNFFLVLPAVMIFLVSILVFLPVDDIVGQITDQLRDVLPEDALSVLTRVLETSLDREQGSLTVLLLSLLGALFIMNSGYAGLITSLNRIYRFEEKRPWLKVRLRALVLSVVTSGLLVAALAMVMVSPLAVDFLTDNPEAPDAVALWLSRLRWPAILAFAVLGIEGTYRYAPCGRLGFRLVSPGALLASGLWLAGTLGFDFYVDNFGAYQNIYGGLGAVIVLLTWLWISALTFLTGAEINMMWKEWRESRREAARV
ncbi:MAG: YihY/virulence factor BrkB family protein [Thermoleophilia bacterium]|nr:YihY/virulence factor BrkB family protein [Thermoleophilia bacterium]